MNILKNNIYLDANQLLKMEGFVHVYVVSVKNVVLVANDLLLDSLESIWKIPKDEVVGSSIVEVFNGNNHVIDLVQEENESVIRCKTPKQFYNVLTVKNNIKIELLTTKFPIYDTSGKIYGVLGTSQYIKKFSISKALSLGLSIREIECLNLVLENRSYKQIANTLNLSPRTVEHYVDNIKDKLNCSTKLDLISKFFQDSLKEDLENNKKIRVTKIYVNPLES